MYEQIYDYENLYKAHCLARRGKRDDSEVMEFELNLATEIYKLQYELKHQIYRLKPYKEFTIYDPKERQIHALHYRDRVVQHSLCDNIIAPYMERHLIYDNATSRKGKGTHFAMGRLNGFLQEFYKEHGNKGFLMKFDVRKYYDNIDHDILKGIYKNAFGYDRKLYELLEQIIDSYQVEEGKGIPLGNQTSQWFALSYLDGLDRLIKEQLHIKYYSRYMDDGVLIHESREYLRECKKQMEEY